MRGCKSETQRTCSTSRCCAELSVHTHTHTHTHTLSHTHIHLYVDTERGTACRGRPNHTHIRMLTLGLGCALYLAQSTSDRMSEAYAALERKAALYDKLGTRLRLAIRQAICVQAHAPAF